LIGAGLIVKKVPLTFGDIMKMRTNPMRKVHPKNKNNINRLPEGAFFPLLFIIKW